MIEPSGNPPLKRDVALQPLSRDHYTGLLQASRLLRASRGSAELRIAEAQAFGAAWDEEIAAHFLDEETLLVGWMSGVDIERMRREHQVIRALAGQLAQQPVPESQTLDALGRLLRSHIRWEERELFGRIEAAAQAGGLAELAVKTAAIEAARPRFRRRGKPG